MHWQYTFYAFTFDEILKLVKIPKIPPFNTAIINYKIKEE